MTEDATNVQNSTESAGTETVETVLATATDEQQGTTQGEATTEGTTEQKENEEKTGAPETYEAFTMPEGIEQDAAVIEAATPIFKELNLTQEQAQKLVDVYAKVQADQQKAVQEFWTNMRAEAAKIPLAEVGLAKVALKNLSDGGKMIADDPMLGNNPAVIKALAELGKRFSEGQFHEGTTGNVPSEQKMLNTLYDKM